MNEEEVLERSRRYAEEKGFKLNPDKKYLDLVIKGLLRNEEKYGELYCPCRPVFGDESDKDKICPCKWHLDEIKKDGFCHCRLFFK